MIGHYLRKKRAREIYAYRRFLATPQRIILGTNSGVDADWSAYYQKNAGRYLI